VVGVVSKAQRCLRHNPCLVNIDMGKKKKKASQKSLQQKISCPLSPQAAQPDGTYFLVVEPWGTPGHPNFVNNVAGWFEMMLADEHQDMRVDVVYTQKQVGDFPVPFNLLNRRHSPAYPCHYRVLQNIRPAAVHWSPPPRRVSIFAVESRFGRTGFVRLRVQLSKLRGPSSHGYVLSIILTLVVESDSQVGQLKSQNTSPYPDTSPFSLPIRLHL